MYKEAFSFNTGRTDNTKGGNHKKLRMTIKKKKNLHLHSKKGKKLYKRTKKLNR